MNRHLVLVGLPGAGKSTVGRLVARLLDVESYDVDAAVEHSEGRSIAETINNRGECAFRNLERAEMERALSRPASVIVPGAGWAAAEANMEAVRDRALTVYLETAPQVAAARVADAGDRPLLEGYDLLARIEDLLTVRRPFYERCAATVSTAGKTVREIADEVAELARRDAAG